MENYTINKLNIFHCILTYKFPILQIFHLIDTSGENISIGYNLVFLSRECDDF